MDAIDNVLGPEDVEVEGEEEGPIDPRCPPIVFTIGGWENEDFARSVLSDDTFKKVYLGAQKSHSGIVEDHSSLHEARGLIDPSEYKIEMDIGHPYLSPIEALVTLINNTGVFKPVVLTEHNHQHIRDIAVTYHLYHPDIIVTYWEDRLWHTSQPKRTELMLKCGVIYYKVNEKSTTNIIEKIKNL